VANYIDRFNHESTREFHLGGFPNTMSLWTQETIWCLEELQHRAQIPRCLWMPHDRHIRGPASSPHEAFGDPGNMVLDTLVHILRLWRFCSTTKLSGVIRVAPQPYGDPGNKSCAGPVNLRGNRIKALLSDLQHTAEPSHWTSTKGKGQGRQGAGKGGSQSSWA